MRSIVNDFRSKDVFRHVVVSSSSRRQILLAVENELVAISTKAHGDTLANHVESEDITVFLLAVLQKFNRVPRFAKVLKLPCI